MELNQRQQTVCEKGLARPVKVMAGAGTGKTRVLVARYVHCLTHERIPPDRLLALTFTNKAAAEMKKRIFDEVKALADPGLLWSLYGAWIMNFHSFGHRLLSENAPAFGIDPSLEVADGVDIARIKQYLRGRFESGRLEGQPVIDAPAVPRPKEFRSRFDKMINIVNKCRSMLIKPGDLERAINGEDHDGYRDYVASVIALWRAYENELGRRGLIDFESMITLVVHKLRKQPDIRNQYTGRFDYILVDEFQDTSDSQNELLQLLSGGKFGKVMVVGDEKQSIYRWRDARVENIRRFPGEKAVLQKNYRSTQGILDLAFRFICLDPYFDRRQEELYLEADRGASQAPVVLFHPPDDAGDSKELEARALAAWIAHLTGKQDVPGFPPLERVDGRRPKLAYDEVAVLLRSLKADSGLAEYEQALRAAGIPYSVVGGANAVEKVVYRQLVSILSVLSDPDDVIALVSLLEGRPFSLSDADLNDLFGAARRQAGPDGAPTINQVLSDDAIAAVGGEEARHSCRRLAGLLGAFKRDQSGLDLRSLVTRLMEHGPFFYELFGSQATSGQVMALTKDLLELADGLRRRNEAHPAVFLEHLRRRLDDREYGHKSEALLPPGRVRIMTIHQAKGLEFPAVAVAGLRAPRSDSAGFFVSKTGGLYLNDNTDWGRGYKDLPEQEADRESQSQESRCLLYVAMTRAKDYLLVSSPHPEGAAARGKTTLFADLLACAREHDLETIEVRTPPKLDRPALPGPAATMEETPARGVTALRQWRLAGSSAEADRLKAPDYRTDVTTVTWRGLRDFERCPRLFFYRYLAGLAELPDAEEITEPGGLDDGGATFAARQRDEKLMLGDLVHRALDTLMGLQPEQRTIEAIDLENLCDQAGLTDKARDKTARDARRALKLFLDSTASRATPEWREEPFFYRRGRVIYHGVLDRVDKAGDEYRIIDYKTGRSKDREKDHFQVRFYAWALRQIKNTDQVTGDLIYLTDGVETDPVETNPEVMGNINKTARLLAWAIGANTFEPAPGGPCDDCLYRRVCPAAPTRGNE